MTDVQQTTDTNPEFADLVPLGTPSTRRGLLAGATAVGATALLAACGTDQSAAPAPEPPAGSVIADPGGGNGATKLATKSEVPVGGGVIKDRLVITQPTEGEFRAFDKMCTHQGCPVTKVTKTIDCACHKSSFSIEDGSPRSGPAKTPLAETKVKLDGNDIVAA
jgi:Rieske Fe-S protein